MAGSYLSEAVDWVVKATRSGSPLFEATSAGFYFLEASKG